MNVEFVEEIPEPARSSVSQETLEKLQGNPNKWAVIAKEGDKGDNGKPLPESTVRSRGVSLQQFVDRRNEKDHLEIAERTINGKLHIYARWLSK